MWCAQAALAVFEEEKAEAMRLRRQQAEEVYMQRRTAEQVPVVL
jgi:hypothetical protein